MKTTTILARAFEQNGAIVLEAQTLINALKANYNDMVSSNLLAINNIVKKDAYVEVSFVSEQDNGVECKYAIIVDDKKVSDFTALVVEKDCIAHIESLNKAIAKKSRMQTEMAIEDMVVNSFAAYLATETIAIAS